MAEPAVTSFGRSLAVGLVVAALSASAGVAAAGVPSFFPLADGNRWTLRAVDGVPGEAKLSVRAATLRGLPGAGPLRVRRSGGGVDAWDAAERRWEPLFRLAAPVGTRYRVDLPRTALWRGIEVEVASRAAVVRDARGRRHRGCVRLVVRARKPLADAGIDEVAFAPGVGPVRIVEQTIAGPRTLLLASAGP